MLKKLAAKINEEKGETWLTEQFMMGVIMDLTAAGILYNILCTLKIIYVNAIFDTWNIAT